MYYSIKIIKEVVIAILFCKGAAIFRSGGECIVCEKYFTQILQLIIYLLRKTNFAKEAKKRIHLG